MRANISDIEDKVVYLLFLGALPNEYTVVRQILRTELRAQYYLQ